MKAMIFAAGLGTRLFPITKDKPKALIEIGGKPLLQIVIEKLINNDIKDIIINVHHLADKIRDFLDSKKNFGINIQLSDETEKLLDTGGGLKKASWFFNDCKAFLVHNVDVVSSIDLKQLVDFHKQSQALATLAVSKRESLRCLLFDKRNCLFGWENKQTDKKIISRTNKGLQHYLAFSGISILSPAIFSYFKNDDTFSIIDVFLTAARKEKILSYPHDPSSWADVGKIENLDKAAKIYSKNTC